MRLTYTVVFPDGLEVPLRTRRRVLLGDRFSVWVGHGYVHAKVIGLGWEGVRFIVNVEEVRA